MSKEVSLIRAIVIVAILFVVLPSSLWAQDTSSSTAVDELNAWLNDRPLNDETLQSLERQPFASVAITKDDCQRAQDLLWEARTEFLRKDRAPEMTARQLVIGDLNMPFWYTTFGDAPPEGRSLYISMHGGGGAPATVNDQQYENQKKLYKPSEGVYLVPRAPTNTWDLWHQSHIDSFFERLITNMIVFENVNPDRVYIMGYSAGGDGVYQLAPRMADQLAAAAMMAGHPNETRPEGLRNIGFTIHMGANDAAYNRNRLAAEWSEKLNALQAADPDGYQHTVTIHEGMGHWMNLQDSVAVPWMAKFRRNVWPQKIVWVQDDVLHSHFYWLKVAADSAKAGDETIATSDANTLRIEKSSAKQLTIRLSDHLLDLDLPVTVIRPDARESQHSVSRTIGSMAASLAERHDAPGISTATISIDVVQ